MFTKKPVKLAQVILVIVLAVNFIALAQDSQADNVLTPDATLDEIIAALRTAPETYETLHIYITDYDHIHNNVMVNEAWLSRVEGTYRWETTSTSFDGEVYKSVEVSNGDYVSTTFNNQAIVLLYPYEPYSVVNGMGLVTTTIAPEAVADTLANSDGWGGQLASEVRIEIAGVELVGSREAIRVAYASEWRMLNLWIDMETGILLQHEIWTPEGELISTVTVNEVAFNPVFDDPETLFYVDESAYDPEAINALFTSVFGDPSVPPTGE